LNRLSHSNHIGHLDHLLLLLGKPGNNSQDSLLFLLRQFIAQLPGEIAIIDTASITTTENFYSHIIEENKTKAAECIADVLIRRKA
jgi:hypothetical protein